MKKTLLKITTSVFALGLAVGMTSCSGGVPKANDSKYFVVGTNAYFPPFEYYDGEYVTGIDMEIGSKIAEKLGKKLYVSDMEFDSLIPAVSNGEIDIAMAGMTVTEERQKTVDFCMEYYTSSQVLTVKAGDTTFDDCETDEDIIAKINSLGSSYTVGCQNGTTGYWFATSDGYEGFKNVNVKGYTTGALAMQDLLNGKVDAVLLDEQPSLMITKGNSNYKVMNDIPLTYESYAFAVKKGNTELVETVKELLLEMSKDESLETLINSYFDGTATFKHKNS